MDKIIFNIMKKLENNGYSAYIVGGYVRDYVLGIKTNDIDICTNALPKDVINILKLRKNIQDNYGCIRIKTRKHNVDITTYRSESNYEFRHPKNIKFINDIKQDLLRRDFTMNSLLMDKNEFIIDYFDSLKDIQEKRIVCIGNVEQKLKEDPLRILRAIRFSSIYDFKIDDEIIDFIKNNRTLLSSISPYRKKQELDKMLSSSNKIESLNLIKELKLEKYLGIKIGKVTPTNNILGMYSQMEIEDSYPFTKLEVDTINKIKSIIVKGRIDNIDLYKNGLYISLIVGEILGIDEYTINKMYNSLPIKSKKDIKISIKTIVKLNNNCYNNINEIYSDIEYAILNGTIKNRNKDIIKFIRKKV